MTTAAARKTRTPEEVAADWLVAKAEEEAANLRRVTIEQEIISMLGCKEKGAKTHHLQGYSVTIEGKLKCKVDWAIYDQHIGKIPATLRPEKMVRTLDDTGVHYLRNEEPDIFRLIAPAITVEPAKAAVKVIPEVMKPSVAAQIERAGTRRVAQIIKSKKK